MRKLLYLQADGSVLDLDGTYRGRVVHAPVVQAQIDNHPMVQVDDRYFFHRECGADTLPKFAGTKSDVLRSVAKELGADFASS